MREKLLRLPQTPWFILIVAFLLRLAWLLSKIAVIPREVLASVPFQNEVGNVASALADGHGFCCLFRQPTGPTAWLSPVYPLLIATVFKLFGTFTFRAFCAAVTLNSLFSALTCFPLFHAAQRIAGQRTAALATWLWAVSPIAIILPYAWIWDSSLSALLAATLLWSTLRLADTLPRTEHHSPSFLSPAPEARQNLAQPVRARCHEQNVGEPRRGGPPPTAESAPEFNVSLKLSGTLGFALYGLLWGLSLLTNPALAALLPFLFLWILFSAAKTTIALASRRLALSFAVLVLSCLPWTIRNYIDFHRFIPMRSNFAYEFWSGNNPVFDPASRNIMSITRYEQTHLYARLGESAFLDQKWQAAKTFVHTHPSLFRQLCLVRIIGTWFGTDSPLHDFINPGPLDADASLVRVLLLWSAACLLAMLVGLVRLYLDRRHYFLPVAVFPLIFPITFYLAHTSLRHRHPIDPIIVLLSAIALLGTNTHQSVTRKARAHHNATLSP